jgi:RNA polymerase sigma-70 factor (ECF subfamily)
LQESSSSEELLERIRRNEPGAFEHFVEEFGDRIFAFGMRVCGDREDAQDVAQDTLLQAFRSLKTLKEPRAIRSWLYRVAANACLMQRRKSAGAKRELSLEELRPRFDGPAGGDVPDFRPLPDENASREELRAAVQGAVRELPKHYRIVLVLRDMEQLSTRETAEALELPESTIKMRLHRARRMVRRSLEATLRNETAKPNP